MDIGFHFLFQLQSRCDFYVAYTANDAAEFYKVLMANNMELGCVQCYLTNLTYYIPIDLKLIKLALLEIVLGRAQKWLDRGYQVGKLTRT